MRPRNVRRHTMLIDVLGAKDVANGCWGRYHPLHNAISAMLVPPFIMEGAVRSDNKQRSQRSRVRCWRLFHEQRSPRSPVSSSDDGPTSPVSKQCWQSGSNLQSTLSTMYMVRDCCAQKDTRFNVCVLTLSVRPPTWAGPDRAKLSVRPPNGAGPGPDWNHPSHVTVSAAILPQACASHPPVGVGPDRISMEAPAPMHVTRGGSIGPNDCSFQREEIATCCCNFLHDLVSHGHLRPMACRVICPIVLRLD
jgi:hypothetical protein